MKNFTKLSYFVIFLAAIDMIGSLLNIWSVERSLFERNIILTFEFLTMALLLLNSFNIKTWVNNNTEDAFYKKIAWLSFISLALCIGGDIVNFNIPNTFFRHGEVIKHDYLLDSTKFFAPGYLVLIFAVCAAALKEGIKKLHIVLAILISIVFGLFSFNNMYIAESGTYVLSIAAAYSVIITLVAFSGILLLLAFGGLKAPKGIWLVTIGCILAAVADFVIGNFWIFGNEGQGFFPTVRYANWLIYVSSQALVVLLPFILVQNKKQ